jgi:opacity protein-like surface antigen
MKKVSVCLFLLCSATLAADTDTDTDTESVENEKSDAKDEFLDLGEPDVNVNGAYYGLGVGLSQISHSLSAVKSGVSETSFDKSSSQFDISLIGGFGTCFYERYYAGIEADFFKRTGGGTSYSSDKQVGIVHNSTIGLNMDIRFGRLYPQHGCLGFVSVGFARVLGRALFDAGSCYSQESFGSFYPTLGAGVEKKINHVWNIRADIKYSVTSKDDNKYIRNSPWKFDGKPSRTALRLSVTRSI